MIAGLQNVPPIEPLRRSPFPPPRAVADASLLLDRAWGLPYHVSMENPSCLSRAGLWRVLSGAVIISFSPVFVKIAPIGPSQAAFYRLLFGGMALLMVALWRRQTFSAPAAVYGVALGAALFFGFDLECWHRAILLVGPGLATILGNFQVFLVALAGALLLRERIPLRLLIAMPLAVTGLWLLLGVSPESLTGDTLHGVGFGFATAFWYSLYILLLRRSQGMTGQLPAEANMALVSLACGAFIGVGVLVRGEGFVIPDATTGGILLLYGVLCQGVGWLLLSSGLPKLPASLGGLVMLAQPALAFVWDILLFGRPTGPLGVVGAGVALFAIWLGLSSGPRSTRVCRPDEDM